MKLKELVDSVSEKMLITISYIFEKTGEITPLALQKILYYIQGIFMVNYGRPLFNEECQASLVKKGYPSTLFFVKIMIPKGEIAVGSNLILNGKISGS